MFDKFIFFLVWVYFSFQNASSYSGYIFLMRFVSQGK
jgi:hypothetical protein